MANGTYPFGEERRTAYSTLHWRLRAYRGPAKRLKCVHCAERAMDWARLHDTDGEDIRDYIPLCRKCHIAYDKSGHHVPHTESARVKMSEAVRQGYLDGTRVGRNTHNEGKTHCPQKHKYTPENTYVSKLGYRYCIKCMRERTRQWRAAQREKKINDPPKVDTHGKGTKRTGQALENIRAGNRRRRERERAAAMPE